MINKKIHGSELFCQKIFWFGLGLFLFYSFNSFAQSVNDINQALDEQNRLQNEQEQKIRRETLEQEKRRILKKPSAIEIKTPEEKEIKGDTHCFNIKEIKLTGATIISAAKQKEITAPYLNKCLGINEINNLMRQITNLYIDKGYVTSRAFIGEQDISKGILELIIVEGKIEDIIINDDSIRDKMSSFTAFPFLSDRKLNLKDIEQGLSQINRLESNSATIKILPGTKPEYSIVKIDNQKTKGRTNLEYNIADSGQKSTGRTMESVYISNDNLLGVNDLLNFNYTDNLGSLDKGKLSKSLYSSVSIPFGYFTFSQTMSKSEYRTTFGGADQKFIARGTTDTYHSGIDYLFYHGKNLQLTLNSGIESKDTKSYIRNTLSDVGSRRLTIVDLGVSSSLYGKYGVLYLKPSFLKGITALNAKKDEGQLPRGVPQAQFTAFKLNGFYSKQLQIPKTEVPFVFNINFDSQISNDELFGSEQFYVGGKYSVRGFDEQSVNGESGAYFQNSVKFNLKDLVKSNNQFLNKYLLNPLAFSLFYDTGFVKPKLENKTYYLSGAGTKITFDHRYFAAELTYSRSINRPVNLIDEGETINFKVRFKVDLF